MKAAVYHRYGPPDVVQIAEVPKPVPKAKEVLVRVRATTVTAGDARLRAANVPRGFGIMLRLGFGITGPRSPILGTELSGEVAAVGSSVTRFTPGDKVFAGKMGCHAEFVAVREDHVAPMPANLSFNEAAALTFGGLTSLYFLRDRARMRPGERVLINGPSGAVGTAAVQLAKHFGGVVTGVCSAANAELVRSLGAERVIDYTREDFAKSGETWDIVLDAVGNVSFARCRPALAPGGRLLLVVAGMGELIGSLLLPSRAGRKVLAGVASSRAADLELLRQVAESGVYRPVIDRIYPFERIAEAYAHVDTGRKKGNVVLTLE
jgi:NADPH:quinone reductase-like Zn-dependent oxidoreductase